MFISFAEPNWMRRNCRSLCGHGSSGQASGWRASSISLALSGKNSSSITCCAQARAIVKSGTTSGKTPCAPAWLRARMNGRGKASSSRSCCNQTAVAGIVDAGSKRGLTGTTGPGYNARPCSRRPMGDAHASHSEAATTKKKKRREDFPLGANLT